MVWGFLCRALPGPGGGSAAGHQSDLRPTLLVAGFLPLPLVGPPALPPDRTTAPPRYASHTCMGVLQVYHHERNIKWLFILGLPIGVAREVKRTPVPDMFEEHVAKLIQVVKDDYDITEMFKQRLASSNSGPTNNPNS